MKQFDPEKTGLQKYPITEHQVPKYEHFNKLFISNFLTTITSSSPQPIYFVTESFEDAKQRMMLVHSTQQQLNLITTSIS